MSKNPCREALARVYEYLDNELPPEDAKRVKQHLEACGVCNDKLRYCQQFQQAIRRVADDLPSAPPHLRERVEEIFRRA